MPASSRHIIRRQVLEIQGLKEEDAQEVQTELAELFNKTILPLLDKYLSAYSPNGTSHRIDTLELDLGKIPKGKLLAEWPKKVEEQLAVHFKQQQSVEDQKAKNKPEAIEDYDPKALSHMDRFVYFVKTGSLPWWVDGEGPDPLGESLNYLLKKPTREFESFLKKSFQNPRSLQRILQQFRFPKWLILGAIFLEVEEKELREQFSSLIYGLQKIAPWKTLSEHRLIYKIGTKFLPYVSYTLNRKKLDSEYWKGFFLALISEQSMNYASFIQRLKIESKHISSNSSSSSSSRREEGKREFPKEKTFYLHIQALWEELETKLPQKSALQKELEKQLKILLNEENLNPETYAIFRDYLLKVLEEILEQEEIKVIQQELKAHQSLHKLKTELKRRIKKLLNSPDFFSDKIVSLPPSLRNPKNLATLGYPALKDLAQKLDAWERKEGLAITLLHRLDELLKEKDLARETRQRFQNYIDHIRVGKFNPAQLKNIESELSAWETRKKISKQVLVQLSEALKEKELSKEKREAFQAAIRGIRAGKLSIAELQNIATELSTWLLRRKISKQLFAQLSEALKEKELRKEKREEFQASIHEIREGKLSLTELQNIATELETWQTRTNVSKQLLTQLSKALTEKELSKEKQQEFEGYILQIQSGKGSPSELQAIQAKWDTWIKEKEKLNRLRERLETYLKSPKLPKEIQIRFQTFLTQINIETGDKIPWKDIKNQLQQWETNRALQTELATRIETQIEGPSLPQELINSFTQILKKLRKAPFSLPALRKIAQSLDQLSSSPIAKVPKSPRKDRFSETEALYVNNAGLVILWPFLPRFFENMGLLKENVFVDEAAQHRAAILLQYQADGQEEVAEYDCGLNKILCGLDWDEVLDIGDPLSDTEKESCQELLQAVIAHAAILGEMSIDGFRGSFLLRKGVLRSGSGHWELQVEKEGYDVVLNKFPWNWNLVKLAWMEWGIEV